MHLDLNKDDSQVVIASTSVFRIYDIEDDRFLERYNLRGSKSQNLNYSCIDVCWNKFDPNLLATAATNGAVVLWNLGRSNRNKQEHVFTEHKRTVNKVVFHPDEYQYLLSGMTGLLSINFQAIDHSPFLQVPKMDPSNYMTSGLMKSQLYFKRKPMFETLHFVPTDTDISSLQALRMETFSCGMFDALTDLRRNGRHIQTTSLLLTGIPNLNIPWPLPVATSKSRCGIQAMLDASM